MSKLLLLLFVLISSACELSDRVGLGADMTHANGLVAAPPKGWTAQATEHGFVFVEPTELRSPRSIRLDVAAGRLDTIGLSCRSVAGGRICSAIEVADGGSGGSLYELTAIQTIGPRVIVVTATAQSEARPDFEPAWATLKHARIE